MNCSLQLILVLLEYDYPDDLFSNDILADAATNQYTNLIRTLDPSHFEAVFIPLYKLLYNPIYADGTYLPSSTKRISGYQELTFLLYQMISLNNVYIINLCSY